jgi:hypothetical protein
MLDSIIYFLLKYLYLLAALLFIIKFLLFIKYKNRRWTLIQFIYFDPTNIQLTPSAERAKLKRVQNQLSIAIMIIIAIQIVSSALF